MKERVAILLTCSPKDAPETAVLIAICSMNSVLDREADQTGEVDQQKCTKKTRNMEILIDAQE